MINILDYPDVINRIGVDKLSPVQKEAHEFIAEGSDNFTNMRQMLDLMEADTDIRETTEMYLAQLEKEFNSKQAPAPAKKAPKHKTQSTRKTGRKARPKRKPKLRFPDLDIHHPLNILNKKSPQYKEALDEYNAKKNPAPAPAPAPKPAATKKPKATPKPKASKAAKDKPAPEPDNATRVPKVPVAVAYINRYRLMNGKTYPKSGKGSVMSFLNSLQKSIEEQVIRKTDKYASEINTIQGQLVKFVNGWWDNSRRKVEIIDYDHYMTIVRSYVVAPLTMLIKRFIKIQGKSDVKKEATNLVKAIEKHIDMKEVSKPDVADMLVSLNSYIDGKSTQIKISEHALNGLMGLAGIIKKDIGLNAHGKISTEKLIKKIKSGAWNGKLTLDNELDNDGILHPISAIYIKINGKEILQHISDDQTKMLRSEKEKYQISTSEYDHIKPKAAYVIEVEKEAKQRSKQLKSKKAAGRSHKNAPANKSIEGFEQTFQDPDLSIKEGDYVETPMGDKGTVRRLTDKHAFLDTPAGSHMVPRHMIRKAQKSLNGHGDMVNSLDLKTMEFHPIGMKGKFLELIGDVCEPWSMMAYGEPGSGKSTLMIDLAHYLASELNRKVAYVSKEEGIGATIQEKFERLNAFHQNIDIWKNRLPEHPENYQYIFIDSVNEFGIEYEELSALQEKWQAKGINPMYIFKGTKGGSFRGSQEYEHLVDVSIKTEEGIARTEKSRYGGKGALVIYTDDTQNIPKFSELVKAEGYRNKAKAKMHIVLGPDGKYWVITPGHADIMRKQGFEIY